MEMNRGLGRGRGHGSAAEKLGLRTGHLQLKNRSQVRKLYKILYWSSAIQIMAIVVPTSCLDKISVSSQYYTTDRCVSIYP